MSLLCTNILFHISGNCLLLCQGWVKCWSCFAPPPVSRQGLVFAAVRCLWRCVHHSLTSVPVASWTSSVRLICWHVGPEGLWPVDSGVYWEVWRLYSLSAPPALWDGFSSGTEREECHWLDHSLPWHLVRLMNRFRAFFCCHSFPSAGMALSIYWRGVSEEFLRWCFSSHLALTSFLFYSL